MAYAPAALQQSSLLSAGRHKHQHSHSHRASLPCCRPCLLPARLQSRNTVGWPRGHPSRAAAEEVEAEAAASSSVGGEFIAVLAPEALPKGVRKEVRVAGLTVLLFWYRNEIFAIEARSPAEGAYSEGFIQAKFTQDYCIECPGTGSLFSIKTGEVVSWYPTNPVLRVLTPKDTCRPLQIFPVKLTADAIMVDVNKAGVAGNLAETRGGAGSSREANNVYAVQPRMYVEGTNPDDGTEEAASPGNSLATPATVAVGSTAIAIVAIAGTAWCVVNEEYILLGLFWVALFGAVAFAAVQYTKDN